MSCGKVATERVAAVSAGETSHRNMQAQADSLDDQMMSSLLSENLIKSLVFRS